LVFYDRRGRFGVVAVDLTSVLLALSNESGWPSEWTYDNSDRSVGFCDAMRKPVYGIRINAKLKEPLDTNLISFQLKDAIGGISTYNSYVGDPLTNWFERPGQFGLHTYHALKKYFFRCATTPGLLDMKVTRVLWEHHLLMCERISLLSAQGIVVPPHIYHSYQALAHQAKIVHRMCFSSMTSNHEFQGDVLSERIEKMEFMETTILSDFAEIF
jgi:hypothetical protein